MRIQFFPNRHNENSREESHSPARQKNHHKKHQVHGFVPEYVLSEIESNVSDPDVLEGVRNARQDLQQVYLGKDPEYLLGQRAYEKVYEEGVDPSELSYEEKNALKKFFEWLSDLIDSIFGRKKKDPSPAPEKRTSSRYVYDAKNTRTLRYLKVRSEGQAETGDKDVDNAYFDAGVLRKFLKEEFGMNSLDNRGMNLHQTVHYGKNYANAFWSGKEMAYGDGDGKIFGHFAQDSTVIHHELGHGIVQNHNRNGGLIYRGESGALNESFADIMAVSLLQYKDGVAVTASTRDHWLIGAKTMLSYKDKDGNTANPALRSFLDEKAYENHPYIGTDRQPKHYKDKYKGSADNGGVHINSGIPNHAFYLASHKIGGNVWETTLKIWFEALEGVPSNCSFEKYALATVEAAIKLSRKANNKVKKQDVQKVIDAWKEVGVLTESKRVQRKLQRIFDQYDFDLQAAAA